MIGLGGVNFVFLMVSPKLISIFLVLPNPTPYSELALLSSYWCFLDFLLTILRDFLSLSNLLLNCVKFCHSGLGFFLPFLMAQKSAFNFLSFSYLRQSLVLCVVCMPPCFLHRLQCFSKQTFLRTLAIDLVPGCYLRFLLLLEAFLEDSNLAFSCVHTRSIASRDG